MFCIAVKDSDSWSRLCCCCTQNQPITEAPAVRIMMNNKAGEAKEFVLRLDCDTVEYNKMEVSSCWGFFDLRLAMAAGDGLDGLEEL